MALISSPQQVALYNNRKKRRARAAQIQATFPDFYALVGGSVAANLRMVPQIGRTRYELIDDADAAFVLAGTTIVSTGPIAPGAYSVVVKATDPSGNSFTKSLSITALESP